MDTDATVTTSGQDADLDEIGARRSTYEAALRPGCSCPTGPKSRFLPPV